MEQLDWMELEISGYGEVYAANNQICLEEKHNDRTNIMFGK